MKAVAKKIIFILAVIMLGGLGGVVANRYLFPYLSSTSLFARYEFLKNSADDITVINKTEQVFVREETSIRKISNGASSSVVSIVSYSGAEAKNYSAGGKSITGVIATSDGIVMAYAPAIKAENMKYKVFTSNGGIYEAEFLGADSFSNLAFFKINANNLPAVSFGDSESEDAGEKIIAVGNSAADYENIYAGGLIRNFDRRYNLAGKTISSSEKLEGVFFADSDFGDSFAGGPVVDYTSQAIGIIGSVEKNGKKEFFIIPSKATKAVIERAIKKELDRNPTLGIYYVSLSKNYAVMNNIPAEKGALVFSPSGQQGLAILAGSPAQKAGLKINDIIAALNGEEINPDNALSNLLYKYKKGDEIELSVLRDGQEIKIKVQL